MPFPALTLHKFYWSFMSYWHYYIFWCHSCIHVQMNVHSRPLSYLQDCVGIKGTALEWFRVFLSDRLNSVSSSPPLPFGLPQGSILGPVLFSLDMLPSGSKISWSSHFTVPQITHRSTFFWNNALKALLDCLLDMKVWIALHFWVSKTKFVLFGPTVDPHWIVIFFPQLKILPKKVWVKSFNIIEDFTELYMHLSQL